MMDVMKGLRMADKIYCRRHGVASGPRQRR
jgi:hypothetical protein